MCFSPGPHTLTHSLSWTNSRSEVRNGVAYTKLWTPDDPRAAKAAGFTVRPFAYDADKVARAESERAWLARYSA